MNKRLLNLYRLYRENYPPRADSILSQMMTRRAELIDLYTKAKEKGDTHKMDMYTKEGLEIREYIQALT